jgi:RNA polymerase sigma-70 factor (ECF subfamily)
MMLDLENLAAEAARGDREAFAELARRLQGPVWRYAYHLTHRLDLADEAAQETWARAVRALRRFRGESQVQTWLLGIARRVVAGLLEEQARQPPAHPPNSPSCSIGLVEVGLALASLPQDLREVLVLTQVVGLSYLEASCVLGIKLGTVRSRVFRARSALVTALSDRLDDVEADDGL